MSKAVRIRQPGGAEEMEVVDIDVGQPGPCDRARAGDGDGWRPPRRRNPPEPSHAGSSRRLHLYDR